jgi:ADP-ribose pyrophosphatase
MQPPEVLGQKLFYRGRKFNFDVTRLRLPNGVEGEWECIRHPGGALVVPVTSTGELVMVRQYRFATSGSVLEFPAGTIEPLEDPATTIAREIQEETGYMAKTWRKLGEFYLAPGYSDETIYAFLATDLEVVPNPPPQDDDEDIETVLLSVDRLTAAIRSGEAIDAKSIAAFFLALPFLANPQTPSQ